MTDNEIRNTLLARMEARREALKLSMGAVGVRAFGAAKEYSYKNFVYGRAKEPKITTIAAFARALETTVGALLGEAPAPAADAQEPRIDQPLLEAVIREILNDVDEITRINPVNKYPPEVLAAAISAQYAALASASGISEPERRRLAMRSLALALVQRPGEPRD